ncbi:uncharacterized protein LOC115241117 [Formica exsecta]|uniref:uncharacterized protein LOC115241117 n=1 Tax=Formica exsecta TaxID=72781 RepID=UPI0011418582|nr:uncharacterized protein LOC115241117 [Formica exsecta]
MVHIGAETSEKSDPDNDTNQQTSAYYSWENVSYDTVDVLRRTHGRKGNVNDAFDIPNIYSVKRLQPYVPILRSRRDSGSTNLTLALKMIADDWMKAKCEKEQRVMIKYAQNARIILIFGYVLMIVGYNFIILLPCFGTSLRYVTNITNLAKNLPLETYYFYNKDQTPYYELTFIAQALLLIIAIASYTGVDNLLGLLVFHLCGQMENLKERLINMKRYKNICVDLTFIVEDHIRLIKYFDIVESTFTLLLLGLLLYFGILFCLCGFLIVAVSRKKENRSLSFSNRIMN